MNEPLKEYFARTDTPAPGSPVGRLMLRILDVCPALEFDQARERARALLEKSARRYRYKLPVVLSLEQEAKRKAHLAEFRQSQAARMAA